MKALRSFKLNVTRRPSQPELNSLFSFYLAASFKNYHKLKLKREFWKEVHLQKRQHHVLKCDKVLAQFLKESLNLNRCLICHCSCLNKLVQVANYCFHKALKYSITVCEQIKTKNNNFREGCLVSVPLASCEDSGQSQDLLVDYNSELVWDWTVIHEREVEGIRDFNTNNK